MKVFSTHFVLTGKSSYKDLAPVFPDILNMLLVEIEQLPEEEEIMQMYIEQNMSDLLNDRKPVGYNRKGKVRIIFPIESKEFYIKSYNKGTDIVSIAEKISEILDAAKISYDINNDDLIAFE